MLFRHPLTIPANTTRTRPVTALVTVVHGTLRHVSISFPPGAVALARVIVLRHEHQIIPANTGAYLAWDNLTISWPEDIDIHEVPYQLKLAGWNLDDTYEHTIVFRFDILETKRQRIGQLAARLLGTRVEG